MILAMRCYCAFHKFVDVWKNNKVRYELRCKHKFNGKFVPFGSKVYCIFISKHNEDSKPKMGRRLVTGIFVGYKF